MEDLYSLLTNKNEFEVHNLFILSNSLRCERQKKNQR